MVDLTASPERKQKKLSASESLFLQRAASPPATPAASPASSGKKNAVRNDDANAASQAKARWDILDIYIYITAYIYIYISRIVCDCECNTVARGSRNNNFFPPEESRSPPKGLLSN